MNRLPWTSSNMESSKEKAKILNQDLEILLNGVWDYMLTLEREV